MKKMTKLFLACFILLISPCYNIETINVVDSTGSIERKNVAEKENYVCYLSGNTKNYLHVVVTPIYDSGETDYGNNQILSFCSEQENCFESRELFAESFIGDVQIFIKKEQIQNSKFYLLVQCHSKTCSFKINIDGQDMPELARDSQHSYYITSNNKEISWKIPKVYYEQEFNGLMEVWVRGMKKIQTQLIYHDDSEVTIEGQKSFNGGVINVFTEKEFACTLSDKTKCYYEFKVTGEEGDMLLVGNKELNTTEKFGLGNMLIPNSGENTGYLKLNINNEECFKFSISSEKVKDVNDTLFIDGFFQTRHGIITYVKIGKDGEDFIDSYDEVSSSKYTKTLSYSQAMELNKVCVKFPDDLPDTLTDIVFHLHLTDPKNKGYFTNIYKPQMSGLIYGRQATSGSIIFFPSTVVNYSKKINYNLRTEDGNAEMYFHECKNFPLCSYTKEDLVNKKDGIIKPHNVNKMYTYTKSNAITTPISPNQYVIIAFCDPYYKEGDNVRTCNFDTSVFSDLDDIQLNQGEPYYQLISQGETDKYSINLDGYTGINKVFVDLLQITGDVTLTIKGQSPYEVHKYSGANKVFYSIHTNKKDNYGELSFSVQGNANSYYFVLYYLVFKDEDENTNRLDSGISYLETVDMKKTGFAYVRLRNNRKSEGQPFLINFNALNCDVDIVRTYDKQKLTVIDNSAQELLEESSEIYHDDFYEYNISIINADETNYYDGKFCFVYVSGLEIDNAASSEKKSIERQIILSENVPQTIQFGRFIKKTKFLYPNSNLDKDVVISFNMHDLAKYEITNYVNDVKTSEPTEITSSTGMTISTYEFKKVCTDPLEVCNIILEIEYNGQIDDSNPILEVFFRSIPTYPSFVPVNKLQTNYIYGGRSMYLFSEVGRNDVGYILLNFKRTSGTIFARLVPKNITEPEEDPNWHNIYHFPRTVDESLSYHSYFKKITFNHEDTKNCYIGCYLLMTINVTVSSQIPESYKANPFTILIRSENMDTKSEKLPIKYFPIEEFVIGNIQKGLNEIKEYYGIILPTDSETVELDIQSDASCFYIKAGGSRPLLNDFHFKYCATGHDSIYTLKKEDIIKYSKQTTQTIKDMVLIIGVYTEKSDMVYSSVFSFKVRQPKKELNVYRVGSDQTVICNTDFISETQGYRCLFVVVYSNLDVLNNLVVYPVAERNTAKIYIYAEPINSSYYDSWDIDYLTKNIPMDGATYSNVKNNTDYLYIPNIKDKQHMFVAVYSDIDNIIQFVTSFYTFDTNVQPNPSSIQIFALKENNMTLEFETTDPLAIYMASVGGEGKLQWDFDPSYTYNLDGRMDRLTLILKEDMTEEPKAKLFIKNLNPKKTTDESELPGFVFYINYFIRPISLSDLTLEEIIYGQSTEISYKEGTFPLIFYSKLPDIKTPLNALVNFYQLHTKEKVVTHVSESAFIFTTLLLNTQAIYKLKENPTSLPVHKNAVKGVFNTVLMGGSIYMDENDMSKFDVTGDDAWVVIEVVKSDEKLPKTFDNLKLETSVTQTGGDYYSSEKIYQYGKVGKNGISRHKLRGFRDSKLMRIEFASNSGKINWSLTSEMSEDYHKNTSDFKFISEKYQDGRTLLTINNYKMDVLLNIFLVNPEDPEFDVKLTSYTFKYILANEESTFKEYKLDNKVVTIDPKFTNITLHKLKNEIETAQVVYLVRTINQADYLKGEKLDTIAMTLSKGTTYGYTNVSLGNSDTVTFPLNDLSIYNNYYINVYIQITDKNGTIVEYIAYETLNTVIAPEGDEGLKPGFIILIIALCVVFIGAIIALIICLQKIKAKNKDLEERVKSFQVEGSGVMGHEENKDTNEKETLL